MYDLRTLKIGKGQERGRGREREEVGWGELGRGKERERG